MFTKPIDVCGGCRQPFRRMLVCSACKTRAYCVGFCSSSPGRRRSMSIASSPSYLLQGEECQKSDWLVHRRYCRLATRPLEERQRVMSAYDNKHTVIFQHMAICRLLRVAESQDGGLVSDEAFNKLSQFYFLHIHLSQVSRTHT